MVLWFSSPWRPGRSWSWATAKHILYYGRHVSATGLVNFFNQSSDVLVASYVLGPASAGVYVVGKRTLIAANALLSGALSRVALPTFSHVRTDATRVAQVFYQAVRLTSVVTTPAFVGLALVAPEFITLFFGPHWTGAVRVMQALSVFGIIQSLGLYNQALVLAFGKPQWLTALTSLYAVVNLLTFTLLSQYGIVAIAVAFTVRGYLLYPLSLGMVTRLTSVTVRGYFRATLVSLIGSAMMAVVVLSLRLQLDHWTVLSRFVALAAAGAGTYAVALLIWGRGEVRMLLSLARGWRPRTA
jgi:O-antigen/teichoic acid export membrane protein